MSALLGAAIGLGGGLLNTALGGALAAGASHKQRRFAREMATRSENFTREMWNAANEYNDPSAQMERLRDAGLNPYLGSALLDGNTAQVAGGSPTYSTDGGYMDAARMATDALTQGVGAFTNAYSNVVSSEGQAIANDAASYNLNKMKANDALGSADGGTAYYAEGRKKLAELQAAQDQATIVSNNAYMSNMERIWSEAQAVDADGRPMVDDAGNSVSNFDSTHTTQARMQQKTLAKVVADVEKTVQETKNLKDLDAGILLENATKKYNLDWLLPAQRQMMIVQTRKYVQEMAVMRSQIALNASQISLNAAHVGLLGEQSLNESWRGAILQDDYLLNHDKTDVERGYLHYDKNLQNDPLNWSIRSATKFFRENVFNTIPLGPVSPLLRIR